MLHGKKVVGLVSTSQWFGSTKNRYDDFYKFTDTYCERLAAAGVTPLGVLPVGEFIRTDVLDLCDAFLLQGGASTRPYHIDVIDHAFRSGKKVLGICLGCQAIHCYFAVKAEAEKRGWTGKLSDLFCQMTRVEEHHFLSRVEGHRPLTYLPYGDKSEAKHPVHFTEDSQLAKIFGRTEVMGASYHICWIEDPAPGEIITGRSDDGITEAIEVGPKIIGTQFHPDVDDQLPEIFAWLAE